MRFNPHSLRSRATRTLLPIKRQSKLICRPDIVRSSIAGTFIMPIVMESREPLRSTITSLQGKGNRAIEYVWITGSI